MVAAFVSRMDSMTNLPVESNTATEMVGWVEGWRQTP